MSDNGLLPSRSRWSDKMRVWGRLGVVRLFFGLALFGISVPALAQNAARWTIAIPFNALSYDVTPLWVAVDEELFRRYGVDATIAGAVQSPALVASVLAGETPYALSGPDAVVSADLNGAGIVILAFGPRNFFAIFTAPNLHTLADLKGKTMGVTQFGTTTDFITRYILNEAGLKVPHDVTLLALGTQENVLPALLTGRIDGAELSANQAIAAQRESQRGKLNEVTDVFRSGLLFPSASLVATRGWVKAHPDETLNVVRGYVAGVARVLADQTATIAAMRKYLHLSDPSMLDDADHLLTQVLQRDPMPRADALRIMLSESENRAAKTADPTRFIDGSFVAALERDGFIDRLYPKDRKQE